MKTILLSLLLFFITAATWAQDDVVYFMETQDELTVSQSVLQDATTLKDIHHRYRDEWVKSYISSEITVSYQGETQSATSKDGRLSKEQKAILDLAKVDSKIDLLIRYLPDNNLSDNSAKEMDYQYTVVPFALAEFKGGEDALNTYINNHVLSQLDMDQLASLDAAKITFDVDSNGSVSDVTLTDSSDNDQIDTVLVKSICEMPDWSPAQNTQGAKIKQNVKFYISGYNKSCGINLLKE